MVLWASEHLAIILPLLIAIYLETCLYSVLHSSRTKETILLYWVLCIEFYQQHPECKYKARRISGPLLTSAYEASLLEFRIHGDGSAEFVDDDRCAIPRNHSPVSPQGFPHGLNPKMNIYTNLSQYIYILKFYRKIFI